MTQTETTAQVGERVTVDVPKRPAMYFAQYLHVSNTGKRMWILSMPYDTARERDDYCNRNHLVWHPVTIPGEDA